MFCWTLFSIFFSILQSDYSFIGKINVLINFQVTSIKILPVNYSFVAGTKKDVLNIWWYLGCILCFSIVFDLVRLGSINSEIELSHTNSWVRFCSIIKLIEPNRSNKFAHLCIIWIISWISSTTEQFDREIGE